MEINGKKFRVVETFDNVVTIPDCFVIGKNKLGGGHGEAKLYFGTKNAVRQFFGGEGFLAECFILKDDLLSYMQTLKEEYMDPSQDYIGKTEMPQLWENRIKQIKKLDDVIFFKLIDQVQLQGPRGYVNSNDVIYKLIREISLPLVSYISAMQVSSPDGKCYFYLKLFVDFDAISEKKNGPLVFTYGHGKELKNDTKSNKSETEIKNARLGQGKYREKLLEECPFCPITMVNDERLLIASHIKPWAVSNNKEKIDYKNGFMLTPLYDKLFDRGFITFTDDKHMIVSNWLSPKNCERLELVNDKYYQRLPIDDERKRYLEYHRNFVFKG